MKKYIKFLICSSLITACLYQVATAKDLISLDYNPDDGIVSISGKVSKEYAGENVTVTVLQVGLGSADVSGITKENVSDHIQYATQMKIENDGSFDDYFPIFNGVTGNYNVRISCPGSEKYQKNIYYLTDDKVAEILTAVNSAQNAAEIESLIKTGNLRMLLTGTAFDNISGEDISKISQMISDNDAYEKVSKLIKDIEDESLLSLFEDNDKNLIIEGYVNQYPEYFARDIEIYDMYQSLSVKTDVFGNMTGKEYSDIDDMCEEFEQNVIVEYLSDQSVWTFIRSTLLKCYEKYPQYPIFENLDISGFKSLSDSGQYNVMQSIITNKKTVDGTDSFVRLFNQGVISAKNTSVTGGTSGSGGSSGGGSGGGQSSQSMGFGGVSMVTNQVSENTFTDLENVAWAKDAIIALKKAGIVSGRSETEFEPSAPVKREEFIKMLTAGFSITADGFESDFKDADRNAWYYPYLGAAQKAGIVYGNEDGSFGVGENITREDMAVMLYRTITSEGVELSIKEAAADFSDSGVISGYAKEAVSLLQQADVINGMENGTFQPKKSSTRAEAAVMLYGILKTAGKV